MCADEPCSLGSEGMNIATYVHAADAPTGVAEFYRRTQHTIQKQISERSRFSENPLRGI
jgi:hypothetical protein